MGIESDWIWFDGKFVPFAEANVHVLSHTLHYGLGAFEGIRAYEQPDGKAGVRRVSGEERGVPAPTTGQAYYRNARLTGESYSDRSGPCVGHIPTNTRCIDFFT